MSAPAELHPVVAEAVAGFEALRDRALDYNADAWSIADAIGDLTISDRAPSVDLYLGSTTHDTLVVTCHDVENLKELTPLFRALRKAGWRADKPEDEPAFRRRAWRLKLLDTDRTARLQVFTSYRDNATCRWVQKGVKEEPVYELVCDGAAAEVTA